MIGIDTDVLVRLLVQDDAAQSERARRAVARAEDAGETIRIDDVVLAETMWTMARRYKATRGQLIEALRALLDAAAFDFQHRPDVERALALFEQSATDFSDCLIFAGNAAAGCRATLTFDRDCRTLPAAQVL